MNLLSPVKRGAFSLVEVTLALGLVSFALIASFGLVMVGLDSARDSVDDTVSSLIFRDALARLDGQPLQVGNGGVYAYSREGLALDGASDPQAYYEARIELLAPDNLNNARCLAAVVEVRWPLVKGAVMDSPERTLTETTLVSTSTPPAWQDAQDTFTPKIDL